MDITLHRPFAEPQLATLRSGQANIFKFTSAALEIGKRIYENEVRRTQKSRMTLVCIESMLYNAPSGCKVRGEEKSRGRCHVYAKHHGKWTVTISRLGGPTRADKITEEFNEANKYYYRRLIQRMA